MQVHAHSVFKEYQLKISQLKELPITTSQYYQCYFTILPIATSQLSGIYPSNNMVKIMTLNELKEKMTC